MSSEEFCVERIIDRSGDIDQRPPEEIGLPASNIVPYSRAARVSVDTRDAHGEPLRRREVQASAPHATLAATADRLQAEIDASHAKAAQQLSSLAESIAAQEKKCAAPRLDAELQEARHARRKMLLENGPEIAERLKEETSSLADLDAFKARNRIAREPHYAASPVLGLGVLFALILAEAVVNGVLFAETSEQGLFGGWLEALVLAIANAGAAFLVGYFALPQINRRSVAAKAGAGILVLAGFAAIIAINLFGAHYRDFKERAFTDAMARAEASRPVPKREATLPSAALKPTLIELPAKTAQPRPAEAKASVSPIVGAKGAEADALRKLVDAPLRIEGFSSLFLLIIGLCAALIAAADGYKFDDPIPGYGRRHRSYRKARAATAATLRRVLHRAGGGAAAPFQQIDRKLDQHAAALAELSGRHHAYAEERRRLQTALDEAVQNGEAEIEKCERVSKAAPRSGFVYALAAKTLPALDGERGKFLETQEKKLRALQKAVQKEKDESFRFLDAAAEGFENVVAEAVRASFKGAGASAPVGPSRTAPC